MELRPRHVEIHVTALTPSRAGSRRFVGTRTGQRDHDSRHAEQRAAWHRAASVPQLLANPQDDVADPIAHDAIIRRHTASAALSLQPKLIMDDFLNHRNFPEEYGVASFHST